MKKNTVGVALIIVSLLAIVFVLLISDGFNFTYGYYLETKEGPMLVRKDGHPISLTADAEEFTETETGEKMLVFHGGVEDTYPARTEVKFIIKLGGASPDNIPASTLFSLRQLGWIEAEE